MKKESTKKLQKERDKKALELEKSLAQKELLQFEEQQKELERLAAERKLSVLDKQIVYLDDDGKEIIKVSLSDEKIDDERKGISKNKEKERNNDSDNEKSKETIEHTSKLNENDSDIAKDNLKVLDAQQKTVETKRISRAEKRKMQKMKFDTNSDYDFENETIFEYVALDEKDKMKTKVEIHDKAKAMLKSKFGRKSKDKKVQKEILKSASGIEKKIEVKTIVNEYKSNEVEKKNEIEKVANKRIASEVTTEIDKQKLSKEIEYEPMLEQDTMTEKGFSSSESNNQNVKLVGESLFDKCDECGLPEKETQENVAVKTKIRAYSSEILIEDIVDYCDYIETTAKKLNAHTARIAGGWGEKRAARMLRELSQSSLSAPSRLEPIDSRMLRGRGSLFVLGVWYAVCLVLYLVSFAVPAHGGVIMTGVILFVFLLGSSIFLSLFLGFPLFKKLYIKKVSYNVVSIIEPENEAKRTLVVSCNYDSALGNNFKTKLNFMPKVLLGALISLIFFAVFCIIKMSIAPDKPAEIVGLTVLPILLSVVSIAALVGYVSLSRKKVKDGNGLSVATTLSAVKYFADKNLIPQDCKVMFVAFAAAHAGHGGAEEFVELHHKEENCFVNPVAINFGEIVDDCITIVSKDATHRQKYSAELVAICEETAEEKDIDIEKYEGYLNSIYGFASTAFAKKHIPTVTILSKDMKNNPLKPVPTREVNRNVIEANFKMAVGTIEKILGE